MKFDEIDMMILKELQEDSRLSIRELAKRINLSPPSVTERVRKLEDEGIIEGYTIKINKKKLGLSVDCIIKVTMKNGGYERFKQFIKDYKRSEWCYRIAGDGCFLVKLSVGELNEIEDFVNIVSEYAITQTIVAFSEVDINNSIAKFIEK
ncbi:Lrp/AsnC family leucine-responsive transcriptional regulator [Clostridium punense]|uniref:Lrp/AsnC family leucine-responsive transcriptional regulator n=1 Tax=Clostridium punense TaxID=1054297 RepID=A0ABS4K6F7_9CLOT|nr:MULTISPECIES: Lrp/AsnC family transcriptional regulator [Clostridium]EQB90435.1 transcriptional regulator [Clostridium sp. BL8]MBP2023363.1 Lrp/AsnC family leucine-responsive transcriptional regulator [Clostridium punense]